MSASLSHPSIASAAWVRPLRFGAEGNADEGGGRCVQWLMKRNCSITPRQLMKFYASLALLSLGIGAMFWAQGATLVMPFAGLEVIGLGAALLIYARHASDREHIRLQAGRLWVEHISGRVTRQAEFASAWVRIEPESGDGSLVELSGQGQRIAIGRFVRPELRRQLAEELRWALRRWQSGPPTGASSTANALQEQSEN
jgi:uncharacterized membrane protein